MWFTTSPGVCHAIATSLLLLQVAALLQSTQDIAAMCTTLSHHSSALQSLAHSYDFNGQVGGDSPLVRQTLLMSDWYDGCAGRC